MSPVFLQAKPTHRWNIADMSRKWILIYTLIHIFNKVNISFVESIDVNTKYHVRETSGETEERHRQNLSMSSTSDKPLSNTTTIAKEAIYNNSNYKSVQNISISRRSLVSNNMNPEFNNTRNYNESNATKSDVPMDREPNTTTSSISGSLWTVDNGTHGVNVTRHRKFNMPSFAEPITTWSIQHFVWFGSAVIVITFVFVMMPLACYACCFKHFAKSSD